MLDFVFEETLVLIPGRPVNLWTDSKKKEMHHPPIHFVIDDLDQLAIEHFFLPNIDMNNLIVDKIFNPDGKVA